jgi:hypothetical protein
MHPHIQILTEIYSSDTTYHPSQQAVSGLGGEFQHKWEAGSLAYLNDAYGDRMMVKNALDEDIRK